MSSVRRPRSKLFRLQATTVITGANIFFCCSEQCVLTESAEPFILLRRRNNQQKFNGLIPVRCHDKHWYDRKHR